jgi:hypothetical protein
MSWNGLMSDVMQSSSKCHEGNVTGMKRLMQDDMKACRNVMLETTRVIQSMQDNMNRPLHASLQVAEVSPDLTRLTLGHHIHKHKPSYTCVNQ